jgi:hypothetical protein
MATSTTSSLGFLCDRQSRKEILPPGPSFNYQPIPRFSSQRRTAARINPFVRVNLADGRTISSAPSLSGNSGVCSWILKFLTDRANDGPPLVSPLLRAALFGSRYKLGAPIVDSRVSHRPVTNEWLTGYILETFFVVLFDISVCSVISDMSLRTSDTPK